MRTKALAALAAGGLLIGAGFVVSAISSPGTAQAQETEENKDRGPVQRLFGFLGQVLDDLVGDGTITQDQADAIEEAARTKAAELKEEHMALREQLSELLDDGVITEEEASELPENHWLFSEALDEAWEDGELSVEEIRDTGLHHLGYSFRRGARLGALLDDGGIDREEYESLAGDHHLAQIDVDEYLDDGLITPDELREAVRGLWNARSGDDT